MLKAQKISVSAQILELDEKLTRYWLSCPLSFEQKIQMEEHLKKILERQRAVSKVVKTNA